MILTRKITIQVKDITQDAELQAVETWRDWINVWAEPILKSNREYYKLATVNSEITEAFKIHYRAGINPHQRVKFRCKYLEIIDAINVDERNFELILTCKGAV